MQSPIPVPVAGQPTWVTILLAVFGGAVALGIAYLATKGAGKRQKTGSDPPENATVTSTDSTVNQYQVAMASMEHLADAYRRAAERSERLEKALRDAEKDKARLRRALDRCQEFTRTLAQGVNDRDNGRGRPDAGVGGEGGE